jgi:hypothetical protein
MDPGRRAIARQPPAQHCGKPGYLTVRRPGRRLPVDLIQPRVTTRRAGYKSVVDGTFRGKEPRRRHLSDRRRDRGVGLSPLRGDETNADPPIIHPPGWMTGSAYHADRSDRGDRVNLAQLGVAGGRTAGRSPRRPGMMAGTGCRPCSAPTGGRPALLGGFLASAGLDLTPFCNAHS